ncbi:putative heavy metal-associated domain, HMA, heavy metal-associated domain superfamily [Helianthus debilis subsp. tardiflorus]
MSIFCASQAAITTMDSDIHHHPSSSKGGRAIDRHNPIIQDQKRLTTTTTLNPTPPPPSPLPPNNKKKSKNTKTNNDQKRKTTAFADENNEEQLVTINNNHQVVRRQGGVLLGWGCTRPGDFISPANSSRFLLSDKALSDQFDPLLKQVPLPTPPPPPPPPLPEKTHKSDDENLFKKGDGNLPSSPVKTSPRTSSSLSSRSSDQQVVVLKVSLHCRGCERKMRKHISKMEGVTSFNIDFMAKKVTVVGDITPLGVLMSVSKVKNAKLLTPTTISTPTPPVDSNFSEIKKQLGFVA